MIKYSVENPADIKEELLPLHQLHYADDFRDEVADLDIDWDKYSDMHDAGVLLCVIARSEGEVVGYMTTTITEHPHNKGYKMASMDTMFVHPDYRGQSIASDLLETTETILIDEDVSWFTVGFRDETVANAVTGKYGYKKVECTFGKTLRKK